MINLIKKGVLFVTITLMILSIISSVYAVKNVPVSVLPRDIEGAPGAEAFFKNTPSADAVECLAKTPANSHKQCSQGQECDGDWDTEPKLCCKGTCKDPEASSDDSATNKCPAGHCKADCTAFATGILKQKDNGLKFPNNPNADCGNNKFCCQSDELQSCAALHSSRYTESETPGAGALRCKGGDGCCPTGCSSSVDSDCDYSGLGNKWPYGQAIDWAGKELLPEGIKDMWGGLMEWFNEDWDMYTNPDRWKDNICNPSNDHIWEFGPESDDGEQYSCNAGQCELTVSMGADIMDYNNGTEDGYLYTLSWFIGGFEEDTWYHVVLSEEKKGQGKSIATPSINLSAGDTHSPGQTGKAIFHKEKFSYMCIKLVEDFNSYRAGIDNDLFEFVTGDTVEEWQKGESWNGWFDAEDIVKSREGDMPCRKIQTSDHTGRGDPSTFEESEKNEEDDGLETTDPSTVDFG